MRPGRETITRVTSPVIRTREPPSIDALPGNAHKDSSLVRGEPARHGCPRASELFGYGCFLEIVIAIRVPALGFPLLYGSCCNFFPVLGIVM